MSLEPALTAHRAPLLLKIVALCAGIATTVFGDFTGHSFEQPRFSSRALQRPDGNIWVIYEQSQNERDVIDAFDVPRLFSTAIVRNNGEHIPGSDRLFEIGDRFTSGFFAMAAQADNKLLLGSERPGTSGQFLRLNADGSADISFNPALTQGVGAVVLQPDGKMIVVPELVRLNPDGSKDPSFSSSVSDTSSAFAGAQSNGKILVSFNSAPYLRRLNSDGSIDPSFSANVSTVVYSGVVLPNDAILLRLYQFDPGGGTQLTLVRLLPDGSADSSFHPDARFDDWYAVQPDGKILAGFRDQAAGQYFLGRMNVDGSLDSSYQTYPIVPGGESQISAVFVQPDGSILAEIIFPIEGQQFLRFSSSGVLEPASKRLFRIPAPVTRLAAQPDGKLLTTGDFDLVDGVRTGPLIRLDNNGNLDASFHPPVIDDNPRGIDLNLERNDSILFSVTTGYQFPQMRLLPDGSIDPAFPRQNLGHHFKVRSDDKIVTADHSRVVQRLLSDGNVDSTFSATQVTFGGPYANSMVDLGIQPDGKVVVAGNGAFYANIHSFPYKAGVFRLNSYGGIDTSFNPPAFSGDSRVNCVAVQVDGKILLGGRFDVFPPTLPNIIRLNSDGSIDNTFTAMPDYTVSKILVEDGGTILIGGGFTKVNGQPAAGVARLQSNGQLDPSFTLDTGGSAVYALTLLADGRVVAGGEFGLVASPALIPARLRNISSRMFVDSGDNALIAGIIVGGSGEKKVLARAIGPALTNVGIITPLQDPILELRNSNGALITSNDDWQQSPDKQAIIDFGLAPGDARESALIATLPANSSTYTAIVRPARGSSGIGLVELYDLDPPESSARLSNISSRGNVLGGDRAMISGFIINGSASMGPVKALLRGIGPTIPLPGTLQNPTLELHDTSGVISVNDDWKQTQQSDIEATGIPPANDRESAILRWFPTGPHTAILRGKDNGIGIGLLELYDLTN
jgi:uncharacterized delta-60 repeat protein